MWDPETKAAAKEPDEDAEGTARSDVQKDNLGSAASEGRGLYSTGTLPEELRHLLDSWFPSSLPLSLAGITSISLWTLSAVLRLDWHDSTWKQIELARSLFSANLSRVW